MRPIRQERGDARKPDQKGHGMANRHPVGEVEGLDVGREHVKPRPVVPERKFHGFEMGAVGKAARVPGERLGPVIVGIELVDTDPIVGCGRQPDDQRRAQQGGSGDDLHIDRGVRSAFRPPVEDTMRHRQSWTHCDPGS